MSCSPEILEFLEECEQQSINIGNGPITHIENGKKYHGTLRNKSIYYSGNFKDHHFAVYPRDRKLPNKNVIHMITTGFVQTVFLNKRIVLLYSMNV